MERMAWLSFMKCERGVWWEQGAGAKNPRFFFNHYCWWKMSVFSRHLATPSCEETPESTAPSEDICTTVPGGLESEKQSYGAISACAW